MKEQKWQRRERKQHKGQYGMRVDGSSVRLLEQIKRAGPAASARSARMTNRIQAHLGAGFYFSSGVLNI